MIIAWQTPQDNIHVSYSNAESHGPLALAITAGLSLCAVLGVLSAITTVGFRTRHEFIRSQVGAYFVSLVFSDLLQAIGSIMNARWVIIMGVTSGPFCTAQAALKQTGNVGTALWSLVIAIHTFCLLFLRLRIGDTVFYFIFIGVWALIGFAVMLGPIVLQKDSLGPFWGISGYWCWITDAYHVEQFTDEYLFMLITATVSIVLYTLLFFRLRGNLQGFGWKLRFCRVKTPWMENPDDESQMSSVGKQMLWYPVAYTVIILPIAICRWSKIFGHNVPYWATMTADSIFMLSGFVNAILYSTTRRIVSFRSLLPFSHLIRIPPTRGNQKHDFSASKTSIDDIKFAIPVLAHTKIDKKTHDQWAPEEEWEKEGNTYFQYGHTDTVRITPPLGIYKLDRTSSPAEKDSHVVKASPLSVQGQVYSLRPRVSLELLRYTSQSLSHNDRATLSPIEALPQSSPETDSAPSIHRKRFSGWSFPSLPGSTPPQGDESALTDLEEMRFATPSPERRLQQPLVRSSSAGDLPTKQWPPRVPSSE